METSPRSTTRLVEVKRVCLVTDSIGDGRPDEQGERDERGGHDDGGGTDLSSVMIFFQRGAESRGVVLPKLASGGHVGSFLGCRFVPLQWCVPIISAAESRHILITTVCNAG